MSIDSLLDFLSEHRALFVYGLLCGYFLKFWRLAKQQFPLAILLLYTYSLWFAGWLIWVVLQLDSLQAWGVFGAMFGLAYFVPLPHGVFNYFKKRHQRAQWREQTRRWQAQREQQAWAAYRQQAQFRFWQEQFIREQAARANQARQNQNFKQQGQQRSSYSNTINLRPAQDFRQYEQLLGLSAGWTQDELKKAYQKQAHRTHPDRWVGEPEHLRQAMEEEYKTIQKAYKTLKGRRVG